MGVSTGHRVLSGVVIVCCTLKGILLPTKGKGEAMQACMEGRGGETTQVVS